MEIDGSNNELFCSVSMLDSCVLVKLKHSGIVLGELVL